MKKINDQVKDVAASALANFAKMSTESSVRSRCMFCFHQPKMPQELISKAKEKYE